MTVWWIIINKYYQMIDSPLRDKEFQWMLVVEKRLLALAVKYKLIELLAVSEELDFYKCS